MERNLNSNPWYNNNNNNNNNNNIPNSQWEYGNNLIPPLIPPLNNNSSLFPAYNNSPNNYASIPLNGFSPFQLYPNPLSYNLPPYNFPIIVNNNNNPIIDFPAINNGTINGAIDETESEMQEDSEEIDALLYSDSEEYNNDDDYDNNDNYLHENYELDSPVIRSNLLNGEEVASTSIIHPKKRRISVDLDASIMDTASSAKCCKNNNNYYNNNDGDDGLEFSDAESSCVGEERETIEEEERENMSEKMEDYLEIKLKRKRIQETVGLLRRIIPGGKGKDAATILDEAISYLKCLKLKAKALGNNNH